MPRELIEPHKGDKRYIRRKGGKFTKSQDDTGRAAAADRRQKSKTATKKGEGDRGDRPRSKSAKAKSAKKTRNKRAGQKAPVKKSLLSRLLG